MKERRRKEPPMKEWDYFETPEEWREHYGLDRMPGGWRARLRDVVVLFRRGLTGDLPPGFTAVHVGRLIKWVELHVAFLALDIKQERAPWDIVRTLLLEGQPPKKEVLLALVANYSIPDDLRAQVVGALIDGTPPGPIPTDPFNIVDSDGYGADRAAWAYRVVRWKRAYSSDYWQRKRHAEARRKKGRWAKPPVGWDSLDEALRRVSKESGMSYSKLRHMLYPAAEQRVTSLP